jgi:nitrite reductase/ring-hydroxylating ferredoxin subunit
VTLARLRVVGTSSLALGESATFELQREGEVSQGFVLRHEAGLFAYLNRCPHWSVDLDMGDARFYAEEVDRIYCKNHGALFRVIDGVCDHGPCLGQALTPLVVELEGEDVWVTWAQEP